MILDNDRKRKRVGPLVFKRFEYQSEDVARYYLREPETENHIEVSKVRFNMLVKRGLASRVDEIFNISTWEL